jgi:uncharacterized protein (DUF1330 family)
MPAYLIARIEVTNWEQYSEYVKATPGVIARYDGRFLVRGGENVTLEGDPETGRIVVIEFPTLDRAKEFFASPEYSRVKALRAGAAIGQFIAVQGFSETTTIPS